MAVFGKWSLQSIVYAICVHRFNLYFSVFFTLYTLNRDRPHVYSDHIDQSSYSCLSVSPIRCTTFSGCSRHPQQTGVLCSGSHCPQSQLAGAPLWEKHPGILCSLPAAQWRWMNPARAVYCLWHDIKHQCIFQCCSLHWGIAVQIPFCFLHATHSLTFQVNSWLCCNNNLCSLL